jgi:chromosome segregation ATPase
MSATLTKIFDRIRSARIQREGEATDVYLALVRRLAKGEDVDANEGAEIIEQFGITEAELAADVATQERRYEAAQHLKEIAELEKELPKLQDAIGDAKGRLNTEVARLQAEIAKAEAAYQRRWHRYQEIQAAPYTLRDTVLDKQLLDREADLHRQMRELGESNRDIREDFEKATYELSRWQVHLETITRSGIPQDEKQIAKARERIKQYEGHIANLTPLYRDFVSKRDALSAEIAKIQKQKLEP